MKYNLGCFGVCLIFFYAICSGFGYSNMHAKLNGRWVLSMVPHYLYDIIETTEACSYMQNKYTHLQSGANTFALFKRKKKHLYKYHLL